MKATTPAPRSDPPPPAPAADYAAVLQRAILRAARRRAGLDTKHPTGPLAQLFPQQLDVIRDRAPFKALLCGRRAGKTGLALRDLAHGMLREPGSSNLFVALSIESAREILWEPFKLANETARWGFKFDNSKMIVTHGNGSRLRVRGADDRRSLERLRGAGLRRVRVDECGAMRPSYLQYLIDEVLEPTLMDAGGDLWVMGTPTVQAFGFFYDVTNGRLPGWSVHRWTAKDNPYVQWHRFIFDPDTGLLARRKWTLDHPIFRREYLAEWVIETERLVYRFLRERNVLGQLPPLMKPHDRYRSVLGLDFGFGDAFAWSLIKYPELFGRWACVTNAGKRHGLAPSECAPIIAELVGEHDPELVVGDVNGLGKGYAVEYVKRFPSLPPIKPAKKADKRGALEIISDLLYVADKSKPYGLFSMEGNEDLHREWSSLQWNETREDVADGQDDDTADSALYAGREVPVFENPADPPPTPEVPAWADEDEERPADDDRPYIEVSDL